MKARPALIFAIVVCAGTAVVANDRDDALARSRAAILARAAQVDALVKAGWLRHDVKPSLAANDQIFMRRVYLDITGTIPTGQQALDFLDDKSPDKRTELIDRLLQSDGYASHYFNYWADVLRVKSSINNVELHGYVQWIKDALRHNEPYDHFVWNLLTAEGRVSENGAAGYYLRDQGMPLDNLSNTVSVFLGTQIGCAQCHDHPFDEWTQKQFYEMAAFTYGINTRVTGKDYQQKRRQVEAEIKKRKLTPQQRQVITQLARYNQWDVQDAPNRQLRFPKDYQYDDVKANSVVEPATIFGSPAAARGTETQRQAFARWATSSDNELFARVIANRLWKKLMGVGLIEPIDDIQGKEASNPQLLDLLARTMVEMKFNMKQYLRLVMNTSVYQRRAVYRDVDEEVYHFPGPTLRRMTAEQIWDSLVTLSMAEPLAASYDQVNAYRFPHFDINNATAAEIVDRGLELYNARQKPKKKPVARSNAPNLMRASEMRQPANVGHFLRDFGQSDRELVDGTNTDPTVAQILTLINGRHHYQIVRDGSQLMEYLKKVDKDPRGRARVIYLTILGREPNSTESRMALQVFEQARQTRKGNTELVWVLLNTPEFMFIQ